MAASAGVPTQAAAGGAYGLPQTLDTTFCRLGHAADGQLNFLNLAAPAGSVAPGGLQVSVVGLVPDDAGAPKAFVSVDAGGGVRVQDGGGAGAPITTGAITTPSLALVASAPGALAGATLTPDATSTTGGATLTNAVVAASGPVFDGVPGGRHRPGALRVFQTGTGPQPAASVANPGGNAVSSLIHLFSIPSDAPSFVSRCNLWRFRGSFNIACTTQQSFFAYVAPTPTTTSAGTAGSLSTAFVTPTVAGSFMTIEVWWYNVGGEAAAASDLYINFQGTGGNVSCTLTSSGWNGTGAGTGGISSLEGWVVSLF